MSIFGQGWIYAREHIAQDQHFMALESQSVASDGNYLLVLNSICIVKLH